MKKVFTTLMVMALMLTTSVTAFAADITEIGGTDGADVKASYRPGGDATIYSVDIEWGAMEFTYNDASTNTWDPDTHLHISSKRKLVRKR